jgi:hypothetical protein
MANIALLATLFGSSSEIARIAGVNKSAVVRWRYGDHRIAPLYQARILREAKKRRLSLKEVEVALGVERCPGCGMIHEPEIRKVVA